MKKIFLFRPSKVWSYCGGGLAIIADSLEECSQLFDEKLFESEEKAEEYSKSDGGHSWGTWALIAEFEVPTETESRIVLRDYNWA